jgi:hypothetical protein
MPRQCGGPGARESIGPPESAARESTRQDSDSGLEADASQIKPDIVASGRKLRQCHGEGHTGGQQANIKGRPCTKNRSRGSLDTETEHC